MMEPLSDLQITLSNLIRAIDNEYLSLSKSTDFPKENLPLKRRQLDCLSVSLDSLTEAYSLCGDMLRCEIDGVDLSELLESLNEKEEGEQ